MYPWFLVTLIDHIAWWFGFHTYVHAVLGERGVRSFHFRRRGPFDRRVQRLKPMFIIDPAMGDTIDLEPDCRLGRRAARRARARDRAAARATL